MGKLKNTFISVKEDLPCHHRELLYENGFTKSVFVIKEGNVPDIAYMSPHVGDRGVDWRWTGVKGEVTHWMPVPKINE